jgi:hypothetical protein
VAEKALSVEEMANALQRNNLKNVVDFNKKRIGSFADHILRRGFTF